jgi:Arc/MetJ-type ribon-helix-helix transcriptional regulator
MDNVSIKLEPSVSRRIEKDMKEFHYSTKTEFIRDAIRLKLRENELERKKAEQWEKLLSMRGVWKGKTRSMTDEEFYQWRKDTSEELVNELKKKYGWKD